MIDLLNSNSEFTIDSRMIGENSIFIALDTGKRNGNDFAENAFTAGAKFLILSREPNFSVPKEKFIVVSDTLEFITDLAREKFAKLKSQGVKTVSLTGSIGKTTTKEFVSFLLKSTGKKVYSSLGSFNNHIGVPLTILNCPQGMEYLILEMGMNHTGEISHLVKIASTDIKIITTITNAHVGNFEEGIRQIAFAKGEILEESNRETIFITRRDLPFLKEITENFFGKIVFISDPSKYSIDVSRNSNITTHFSFDNLREYAIKKPVTREWLYSLSFGFKVLEVLELKFPDDIMEFEIPGGRGNEIKLTQTCTLIDESYNSSTEAAINAIRTAGLYEGKKLIVLGGMKELGSETMLSHEKVLNEALKLKDTDIILVGEEFINASHNLKKDILSFQTSNDLIHNFTKEKALEYNVVLVKSSKSVYLSKFSESLKN